VENNFDQDCLHSANANESTNQDNTLFLMDTTVTANDYLPGDTTTVGQDDDYLMNEHEYILVNDEYYFNSEQDYEDYEDQLYIDSLTEEEALALLRSESEMYALQMAQAAKSGILLNESANSMASGSEIIGASDSDSKAGKSGKKSKNKNKKRKNKNVAENPSSISTIKKPR
jgi:hypothetical protein